MRSQLLYVILLAACFVACKKDKKNNTAPVGKTYQVSFNVTGSNSTIMSSGSKKSVNGLNVDGAEPVSNGAKVLYFVVIDQNAQIVHQIKQDSTMSNFGHIDDNLQAGSYTVVLLAGQGGLNLSNGDQILSYQPELGQPPIYTAGWQDTFLKKFPITVTDAGLTQDVALDRVVGELEININDALPANAASFSVGLINEYLSLTTDGQPQSPHAVTYSNTIPAASKGATNYQLFFILGNTINSFQVNLTCYDAAKHIIANKIIASVTCAKNTKTILSGNLFTSGNYNVNANNAWDPGIYRTINL